MKKIEVSVCLVLAIVSVIIAAVYFSKTAGSLPHFFLGYAHGSVHKHIKHGLAFLVLCLVFLLGAWMLSAKTPDSDS